MKRLLILIAFACPFSSAVLVEAGVYSDTVLANNPLAYWRLGESTGPTVSDETSNGNDGTATAGVLFGQSSLLPAEPANTAIGTSGNDRVVVPAFEKFPTGSTGYTAEYWLTVNSAPTGYYNIVGDGESGGDFYMMNYLTTASRIRPHFAGAGTTSIDSNTVLQVGQTYHVATTWDKTSGLGSVYIDGELDNQANVGSGGPSNSNNPIYLGKDNREPGGDFTLDEVAFYNQPLSAGEIALHEFVGREGYVPMSVSLSTDVLGPGHFSVGSWDSQNGYTNGGTVELVGMFSQAGAGSVKLTRQPGGPTADLSVYVAGDSTAGDWGSDTHGRNFNLWLPGDGESNEPHVGFGCHANKFITFDLDAVRQQHLPGDSTLIFTAQVGTNGNVPSNTYEMEGGVWLDGVLLETSGLKSRNDVSHPFNIVLPSTGRYLTLAALNGDSSTVYDDVTFRNAMLWKMATVVTESRGQSQPNHNFTTIDGPSDSDYADVHSGNGVTFTLDGGSAYNAGQVPDGNGQITVLNDGIFPAGTGTPANKETFLHLDGPDEYFRFLIDLNVPDDRSLEISQINVFGSNTSDVRRDYMVFDLYGSDDLVAPGTIGEPVANGWVPIAYVSEIHDPKNTYTRIGANITDINQSFRHLLFYGFPDPNLVGGYSSHYLEFDIHAQVVPEPTSVCLLGLGALGLLTFARRRK